MAEAPIPGTFKQMSIYLKGHYGHSCELCVVYRMDTNRTCVTLGLCQGERTYQENVTNNGS